MAHNDVLFMLVRTDAESVRAVTDGGLTLDQLRKARENCDLMVHRIDEMVADLERRSRAVVRPYYGG